MSDVVNQPLYSREAFRDKLRAFASAISQCESKGRFSAACDAFEAMEIANASFVRHVEGTSSDWASSIDAQDMVKVLKSFESALGRIKVFDLSDRSEDQQKASLGVVKDTLRSHLKSILGEEMVARPSRSPLLQKSLA